MSAPRVRRVAVVGAGAAGAYAALGLCEAGIPAVLIATGRPLESSSALEQAGIDWDQDSNTHFEDTIRAGGFRGHSAAVRAMVEAAPSIVHGLGRMGVPFERTSEGNVLRFATEGCTARRTAYAGARTGKSVMAALESQLRRWAATDAVDARGTVLPGERMLELRVPEEFTTLALDDNGVAVGVVVRDPRTGRMRAIPTDAVCVATGGATSFFAEATGSTLATGHAAMELFRLGAAFVDAHLVQLCPTAIQTPSKRRGLGPLARALGGRLFVETGEGRDYFLEHGRAANSNLGSANDVARAVAKRGGAFLDLSHLRRTDIDRLQPLLQQYDARSKPIPIVPALHGTLGGLLIDFEVSDAGRLVSDSPRNHATTIPGLYAAGDVACAHHGANALAGNALSSAAFGGLMAARAMASYCQSLARGARELPSSLFDKAQTRASEGAVDGANKANDLASAMLEVALGQPEHDAVLRASEGASAAAASFAKLFLDSAKNARQDRRTFALADGDAIRFVAECSYACAGTSVEITSSLETRGSEGA